MAVHAILNFSSKSSHLWNVINTTSQYFADRLKRLFFPSKMLEYTSYQNPRWRWLPFCGKRQIHVCFRND